MLPKLTRLAAIAALAILAGAAPAQAGPWRDHARQVARDTFGTPACGEPRIIRRDPLTYAGGHQAELLRIATAWADPFVCAVIINSHRRIHTKWRFCHVVAHEWGHLVLGSTHFDGDAHSTDPLDLMYSEETGIEGKIKRPRQRSYWIADGYYGPCKPPTITRRGNQVVGSFTN